jgi:hypothetical protein
MTINVETILLPSLHSVGCAANKPIINKKQKRVKDDIFNPIYPRQTCQVFLKADCLLSG